MIFHVARHPNLTTYEQCITYGSFPTRAHELTYSFFGMIAMYGIPLVVIIFTYSSILIEIFRRSRDTEASGNNFYHSSINNLLLIRSCVTDNIRRSSLGFLGRAKVRTLKMTIIIVLVFVICWTPYYVMCMW